MKVTVELSPAEWKVLADALAEKAVDKADVPTLIDKFIGGVFK